MIYKLLIVLFLSAFQVSAFAAMPDEVLKDPALEQRAEALTRELRCMVCQNQSIEESDAPLARDLRLLVREQIAAGKSDDEIRDFLVARYGDFILLKPPLKPETYLLWAAPFLVLAGAFAYVVSRMKRR